VRDLLAYIPFRIAAGIFGLFPEPWVRHIGMWAGRRAAARDKDKYDLVSGHMRRVRGGDVSDEQLSRDVTRMYESYGRYWAETFWLRRRRHDAIISRVDRVNFDPVYRAKAAGRGIIYALPHTGNWEVAGLIADDIGARALAVAEDLSNRRITEWFLRVRNSVGIDIVLTSDPSRQSKLVRTLKAGGAIALLADRDVTGTGHEVDFFGEMTRMPTGPAGLAVLTGADLFPVGVYFKEGAGHRLVVRDPIEIPDIPDRGEKVAAVARALAKELEDLIRHDPPQWHLFQPNWPSDEGYR
jgi:KDO2-lipid IV(A) lauroyltransferase